MFGVEFLDVNNVVFGNFEVYGVIGDEEWVIGDSVIFLGEDVLFEGFIFVDFLSEVFVSGNVGLGLDDIFGLEEGIDEFGGVKVEVESVVLYESLNEMFKESEVL